ncbi:hypothetical protein [Anoxynatronum buryatiense]|uniref:Uncharacterized protein n=1 Tax=Anoxynatronum buryatiense TaxID=489973 RepID=A0AA46AHF1_9CLOT|nr:hypothetical protein [Anoxynatronum buryatiense]SMP38614.1 hypothetical protein SAMN06296020_101124 [Anoxynatronum buryatiense]
MNMWKKANDLREFEGKNSEDAQYTAMQKRVMLLKGPSMKTSLKLMGIGFGCVLAVTGIELIATHPAVTGLLAGFFKVSFFIGLAGALLIPYGLYHVIRNIKL